MPYLLNGVLQETSLQYKHARVLNTNQSTVGNVGGGTTNLMSYVIPAGTLASDGDGVLIEMRGSFVIDPTGFAQVGLIVGGTTVLENDLTDISTIGYTTVFQIRLIRASATTAKVVIPAMTLVTDLSGTNIQVDLASNNGTPQTVLNLNPGVTWGSNATVQVYCILTGSTTNNRITQDFLRVTYEPTN